MIRLAPVLVLLTTVALADEKPPVEKPAPATTEDAIAAARREFQSLKTARGAAAEQAGLELPRMTTPQLQLGGSPAPAATGPLRGDPGPRKKSANWLVDGAQKRPDQGSGEKSSPGRLSSAGREDPDPDQNQDSARANPRKTDESSSGKPGGADTNPLTRYMAGWMTPQDYTLLRPGLGGEMASDMAGRGDPSLRMPGSSVIEPGADGRDFAFSLSGTDAASAPSQIARENPFLQISTPPAQLKSAFILPPAPEPSGLSSSQLLIPVEPASAKPKVPDIAKPSDDAKYFKQLKRF